MNIRWGLAKPSLLLKCEACCASRLTFHVEYAKSALPGSILCSMFKKAFSISRAVLKALF